MIILENKITDIYGEDSLYNYEITGKFKPENRIIDKSLIRSGFEIVARKCVIPFDSSLKDDFAYNVGLNSPITFCYNFGETEDFLSISASLGYDVPLLSHGWIDFSVIVYEDQYIFTVGKNKKFYSFSSKSKGGFAFRASNCRLLIDDIKFEELSEFDISSFIPDCVTINQYDTLRVSEILPVHGIDWCSECIFDKNTVTFLHQHKSGDIVTFNSRVRTVSVLLTDGGMSQVEYIKNTAKKRSLTMLYIMRRGYETNLSLDPDLYHTMGRRARQICAKIILDPNEKNYDDEINWLVDMAKWDSDVHPHGLACTDFNLLQMYALWKHLCNHADISEKTWEKLVGYLQTAMYCTEEHVLSENHLLTYIAGALAVAETWQNKIMWNGKTGRENVVFYRNELEKFIVRRLKYGWIEFDGLYVGASGIALIFIVNYVSDSISKQLAMGALEVLSCDSILDTLNGLGTGGRSRVYANVYLEAGTTVNYILTGQSFGNVKEDHTSLSNNIVLPLNKYVPTDVLLSIASEKNKKYVNFERKQVFHIPDDPGITESLKKSTYITPKYAIGAINQYDKVQDLKDLTRPHSKPALCDVWVPQGHQEMPWSLYFGKTRECLIFDGHPGGNESDISSMHNYWTGDTGCLDYKYLHNENVVLGLHKIENENELPFTHFYIPKDKFEHIDEENGWIFICHQGVYAGIKPLKDGIVTSNAAYVWTSYGVNVGCEIKIESRNTAFICEVASNDQYQQGFSAFKAALNENHVIYKNGAIEYTGLNGKKMYLDYTVSKLEDKEICFNDYKLYNSPYMQSEWGSGVVQLSYNGKIVTILSNDEMIKE